MMRLASGAGSRGLSLRATAASKRVAGKRSFVQNALAAASSASYVGLATTATARGTSSPPRPRHEASTTTTSTSVGGGDDGVLMRFVVLAMGSALALWSASPEPSEVEAGAAVPSRTAAVACSAATSSGGGGDGSPHSAPGSPRRLTKRRSIVQEQDEREQSWSSSYSAVNPPSPPSPEDVAAAGEPAVALVVASTYNGNGPIEDRHDIRQSPRGDFFVSVLDGHGGWQAAEHARKRLNISAQTELKSTLAVNPEQVKGALTQAFLRVEREYLYQVKAAFELGFGAVARTGACAIMALVRDNRLFVANAGDCRAVLGRRRPSSDARQVGGWGSLQAGDGDPEAVALSNDHNAKEAAEQAKLKRLHPFEGDVFTCKRPASCYVKGRLQPTRSFGDAYLKYPEFNGKEGTHRSAGRFLPPPYTPPYITAEPEISVHDINAAQDDFVVLASDGLWDHVSNQEAVEIVRKAAYDDGKPESAGDRLVQRVLERAADNHGISVAELQEVPEGNRRRSMHDDITIVVFYLNGNRNNKPFRALQGCTVEGVALTPSPPAQ